MEDFDNLIANRFEGMEAPMPPQGWAKMERALWIARWKPRLVYGLIGLCIITLPSLWWMMPKSSLITGLAAQKPSVQLQPKAQPQAFTEPIAPRLWPAQTPIVPFVSRSAAQPIWLDSHREMFSVGQAGMAGVATAETSPSAFAESPAAFAVGLLPNDQQESSAKDALPKPAKQSVQPAPLSALPDNIAAASSAYPLSPAEQRPSQQPNLGGDLSASASVGLTSQTPAIDPETASTNATMSAATTQAAEASDILTPVRVAITSLAQLNLTTGEELPIAPGTAASPIQPQLPAKVRFMEVRIASRIANKMARSNGRFESWNLENVNEVYAERVGFELGLAFGNSLPANAQNYFPLSRFDWRVGISLLNMNEQLTYTTFDANAELTQQSLINATTITVGRDYQRSYQMNANLFYATANFGLDYYISSSRRTFLSFGGGVGYLLDGLSSVGGDHHLQIRTLNPFGYLGLGKFVPLGVLGSSQQLRIGPSVHYYPTAIGGALDVRTMTIGLDITLRRY